MTQPYRNAILKYILQIVIGIGFGFYFHSWNIGVIAFSIALLHCVIEAEKA